MGLEQPDSGEVVMGQTVVPMYSEQSREGLSNDNTVRICLHTNDATCCGRNGSILSIQVMEKSIVTYFMGNSHVLLLSRVMGEFGAAVHL